MLKAIEFDGLIFLYLVKLFLEVNVFRHCGKTVEKFSFYPTNRILMITT